MSVTVSGNLNDLTQTGVAAYAVFTLVNYSTNIPRIIGTTSIVNRIQKFQANASGLISGTIIGNDVIDPAGTFYNVTITDSGGIQLAGCNYSFNITGGSFNLNSATPITTAPVVTPPTGDTTYQRLDGGNKPTGSYVPNTDNAIDLGSTGAGWRNVYANTGFTVSSASYQLNVQGANTSVSGVAGGAILIAGGNGGPVSGQGGNVTVQAGTSSGVGTAGALTLRSGVGGASVTGGNLIIKPGTGGAGDGNILIQSASGAQQMGITTKTGNATYSTTSSTFADVDATNLAFTTTVPTGWKLFCIATGEVAPSTDYLIGQLFDTQGSVVLQRIALGGGAAGAATWDLGLSLIGTVTGDGLSHTVKLQFANNNNATSVQINGFNGRFAKMVFTLMPSN